MIAANLSNNVLTSLFIGNETDHLIPSLRFVAVNFPKTQRLVSTAAKNPPGDFWFKDK